MCIPSLCYILLANEDDLLHWVCDINRNYLACSLHSAISWKMRDSMPPPTPGPPTLERSLLGKTSSNAKGCQGAVELQHLPNALRCFHQIPEAVRIWEPAGAQRDLNLGLCDVETTDGGPRKSWHLAIQFVAMSLIGTRTHSTSGKKTWMNSHEIHDPRSLGYIRWYLEKYLTSFHSWRLMPIN